MSADLGGRIALVTGGTRGLGHGIASELAAVGATVYLTGRTDVEAAAARVAGAGGTAIGVSCDHHDDAAVAAVFDRIATKQGRLDILVNCAATVPAQVQTYLESFRPFWESGPAVWDTWCDVGLRSHYVAAIHAARLMTAQRSGLIVNVSSAAAGHYFGSVAYGVGKAALDRMTADMAVQLRDHRVAAVSIWPGAVRTETTATFEQAGLASLADAESTAFAGRAVVALAADPAVLEQTGAARYVAELARDYGFTELDGSQPGLPTYGGILDHNVAGGCS
ncbi:SDR family NAD(P)-dependent oxidoreductase [Mycolicibacterium sp. CH28]|uniref:SDR family NAD(P)-dependent oxidoreductase n=1 Tax=Mycolicibacterium sp. CH28 TaxID=2512237 RepID=UPI001080DFE3|nr:SDR family NAD(P)-dependent oxidoreductase [Mycolicibacterium sp. CH28]TGD88407.1 SDR family NAD(P)-dependent oxidoreductase [Mycolicibacterium sp. CH28]